MIRDIPLSQHDLLDPPDCEEIRDQVIGLKEYWTPRSDSGPMYTLGAASYLDAPQEQKTYLEAAQITNPLVGGEFEWLHAQVKNFFEELLGEPAFFDEQYALPGFHVFVFKGDDLGNDNVAARAHFDLQWMQAIPNCFPSGTLSFTLPIEQPTGGASMAIWPTRYEEAVRLGFTAVEYASQHAPQIISYVPGRMVVHDGYILHAIGSSSVRAPEGLRITLQGHGVRMPQGWLLYW